MNCEQVKDLLSAYLDGMLVPEEFRHVTNHVQTCSECSNTLRDFRYFDALLAQLPRIAPVSAFPDQIFASTEYRGSSSAFALSGTFKGQQQSRVQCNSQNYPQLIALPGGRTRASVQPRYLPPHTLSSRRKPAIPRNILGEASTVKRRGKCYNSCSLIAPQVGDCTRLRVMPVLIVAAVLLSLGISGFIRWHLWQKAR